MTTVHVARQNIILSEHGKTTKLSAQDIFKELKTIRHVLEKVEETNGKVLQQIQIRAKEPSVFEDTASRIADTRKKAKRMGDVMDSGQTRLNELEKTVNLVCSKADEVINEIQKADKEEHRNEAERGTKLKSKDIGRSRKTTDETINSGSKVKVKVSEKPVHDVQKTKKIDKSESGKQQTTDPPDDLPSMVCISGFKSRRTLESSDNRQKTDKLAQQKQMESQRPKTAGTQSDLDPTYVNIKNTTVRIREQEARFEADFKSMPGLNPDILDGQGSDTMLVALVWQQWHSYAESEKNKDSQRHIVRAKGPDVVLCLDTSQSMEGAPFEEMMSFAMKYVEGVERIAATVCIQENISVTTFGYITKVWQHLTSDYNAVKATLREIWSLIPRGRSPIAGGLLVALAGCLGNADGIVIGNIPVLARVILVSDGKGTPDHIKTGPELTRAQDEDMRSSLRVDGNLRDVSKNLKKRKHMVCCVPVGNANMKALEEISKITGGKVFLPSSRDRLVKWSGLTLMAADMCKKSLDLAEGKSTSEMESTLKLAMEMQMFSETEDDKKDVISIANQLSRVVEESSDEHKTFEHDSDLPALGTRVRRGPGWHYPDFQDSKGPGTVCSHGQSGMVWVEWDNSHRNCYNYKAGALEVVAVTEKRVLRKDELIATGCYVRRGDNWSKGDEDGGPGTQGVVTRVHQDGTVIVRWPNKVYKEYKFGSEGIFEVQVCTDDTSTAHTQEPEPNRHVAPEGDGLRIESFLPPP